MMTKINVHTGKRKIPRQHSNRLVTNADLKANNPALLALFGNKVKPWMPIFGFIIAGGTATGFLVSAWIYFGGSWLVSDKTLSKSLNEVHKNIVETKEEVKKNIVETKDEVTALANENKKGVDDVKNQINILSTKADRNTLANLETQQRTIYVQKESVTGQLAAVRERIRSDPNDGLAYNREQELQSYLGIINRDFERITDQIEKAKRGE
jgi:hypothetical protein